MLHCRLSNDHQFRYELLQKKTLRNNTMEELLRKKKVKLLLTLLKKYHAYIGNHHRVVSLKC